VAKRLGPRETPFDAFKPLRNRFRQIRLGEVIGSCLRTLNHPNAQAWDRMRHYRPWEILMLFKWALIHGEWNDRLTRPLRGEGEFNHLVNLTSEVFNCARLPSGYDAVHLFMRNMAYQQFWLQAEMQAGGLARQSLIFGGLQDNHRLRRTFREHFSVDIPEFLELSLMLVPKIMLREEPPGFSKEWFSPVSSTLSPGAVDGFLYALSSTVDRARNLAIAKRATDMNWELFERTPFQARPLLHVRDQYVPLSKALLARTLELFVYRALREFDAEDFMQAFGPMFERYVLRVLDHSGVRYFREDDLKEAYPGEKIVDVLMRDGEDNILLDAKGIEFPEIGMITHLPDIVRDRAKPSILKAIDQAHSTLAAIRRGGNGIGLGLGRTYLLVVTMQDTFLGNGTDFFSMVRKDELERIQARYPKDAAIPAEQMYFVAVQDIEVLSQLVKSGATTFAKALRTAQQDDAVGSTKKFIFHQHLAEHFDAPSLLPFLEDEIDRIFDRCEMRFPIGERNRTEGAPQ
jgi:hypothetical protein